MLLDSENLLNHLTALTWQDQIELLKKYFKSVKTKKHYNKFLKDLQLLKQINNPIDQQYKESLNELIKKTEQKIKELQ